MLICEKCNATFASIQLKANHVRWKHRDKPYTDDGLRRIKENARKVNANRHGPKTYTTENRKCECNKIFSVTFSPERRYKGRKTCSRHCASKRKMSDQGKESIRQYHRNHPEVWVLKGIQSNKNNRFSSKAERSLAALLVEHGFKRHYYVKTQDIRFDVDIVSIDKKVWIESDGSWHFRKIHKGHNFEATKLRDRLEEQEAIKRCVLLIRVNNETTTIDQQMSFVFEQVKLWDKISGKIVRLGYNSLQTTEVM